jgi:DNA-directed RNA polymerase specialized sigma24 family protein
MMVYDDRTDMGGTGAEFLTTHWSAIEAVGTTADDRNRALVGLLLNRYWKPVYCYLRRLRYNNEQAKDLTQSFFHEVVLGRQLIQKADRSKGRFRSFLLTALKRHLINVRKKETARKRIPKDRLVPLDMIDPSELPQSSVHLTPEDAFNYGWVSSMMERVLGEVEAKCREDGRATYWQAFHDRVLKPITEQTDPPSVQQICEKYGIADGVKLANMVVTVKRRIRAALKEHVRDSVLSGEEANSEFEEIMQFFPEVAQNGE